MISPHTPNMEATEQGNWAYEIATTTLPLTCPVTILSYALERRHRVEDRLDLVYVKGRLYEGPSERLT